MTVKELVEKHLSHLGTPTGTHETCPKCGDRCPEHTGLITVSLGEADVFVGCYVCLDKEVADNPLALGMLETMFASVEHVQKLQRYTDWLKLCLHEHTGMDADAFEAWVERQAADMPAVAFMS